MNHSDFISIQQFCTHYKVPVGFVEALRNYNLVEVIISDNDIYLHTNQLNAVEKIICLHYDLNINFEGIDAIHNLLEQVEQLQNEVRLLNNKLRFYEDF